MIKYKIMCIKNSGANYKFSSNTVFFTLNYLTISFYIPLFLPQNFYPGYSSVIFFCIWNKNTLFLQAN